MNVVYHLTSPPPVFPGADAVFQDVDLLRGRFGGQTVNLFPLRSPSLWFPRCLYGFHCRRRLKEMDRSADLHHVFYADLYPFPVLRALRRPVVYSVVAGLDVIRRPSAGALNGIRQVVVSNERDREILNEWGLSNHTLIRPGIDNSRFSYVPAPPPSAGFRLLAGSAPWVERQFRQKGVDALLEVAARIPDLRLVFLWRGRLYEPLARRIRQLGLQQRVEVLNERVRVNDVLARVHAAVVLAETSRIVKAYPHSLLESLAAGKPVLISRTIPMADYVRDMGCGKVAEGMDPESLAAAIGGFRADYDRLQRNALCMGRRDFSHENLLASYEKLYDSVITKA